MKKILSILGLSLWAATAPATIIHIPLGDRLGETPWWVSNPTQSAAIDGWQFAQTTETNLTAIDARLSAAESSVGGLPDASTNSLINTLKQVAYFTNGFTWSSAATNYLSLSVTNPAGVNYSMPQGAADLYYSLDNTNWVGIGASTLLWTGRV